MAKVRSIPFDDEIDGEYLEEIERSAREITDLKEQITVLNDKVEEISRGGGDGASKGSSSDFDKLINALLSRTGGEVPTHKPRNYPSTFKDDEEYIVLFNNPNGMIEKGVFNGKLAARYYLKKSEGRSNVAEVLKLSDYQKREKEVQQHNQKIIQEREKKRGEAKK